MCKNFTDKFYDPVFRMTYRFIYGDFKYYKALMHKLYKQVDDDGNCGGKTLCMAPDESECIEEIIIYVDNTAPEDYVKSSIIHESMHATYFLLKSRNIEMDIKEAEVSAYYQEFLVKTCNDFITSRNKKNIEKAKNGK